MSHGGMDPLLGCPSGPWPWVGSPQVPGRCLLHCTCGPGAGRGRLLLRSTRRTQVNLRWVLLGAWQAVVLVKVVQAQLCSVTLYSS